MYGFKSDSGTAFGLFSCDDLSDTMYFDMDGSTYWLSSMEC